MFIQPKYDGNIIIENNEDQELLLWKNKKINNLILNEYYNITPLVCNKSNNLFSKHLINNGIIDYALLYSCIDYLIPTELKKLQYLYNNKIHVLFPSPKIQLSMYFCLRLIPLILLNFIRVFKFHTEILFSDNIDNTYNTQEHYDIILLNILLKTFKYSLSPYYIDMLENLICQKFHYNLSIDDYTPNLTEYLPTTNIFYNNYYHQVVQSFSLYTIISLELFNKIKSTNTERKLFIMECNKKLLKYPSLFKNLYILIEFINHTYEFISNYKKLSHKTLINKHISIALNISIENLSLEVLYNLTPTKEYFHKLDDNNQKIIQSNTNNKHIKINEEENKIFIIEPNEITFTLISQDENKDPLDEEISMLFCDD